MLMRACVLYLRTSAKRFAARPHAVSSATTRDILNSGLYSAQSGAGKRTRAAMRRAALKITLFPPSYASALLSHMRRPGPDRQVATLAGGAMARLQKPPR